VAIHNGHTLGPENFQLLLPGLLIPKNDFCRTEEQSKLFEHLASTNW